MKAKDYKSILGLAFEGRALSLCLMQRRGGQPQIEKTLKAPLTLDPLSSDPELIGREIRNHLDAAGIRERNCAVCLPLSWVLMAHTDLPDLTGEDLDSYISLQVERAFPFAPEDLSIATSYVRPIEGQGQATVIAISKNTINSLQNVFKAAGLKPVFFTLGVGTVPKTTDAAILIANDGGLDLAVFQGGGYAVIRSFDEALENGPEGMEWDTELVAQQLRISLGRLPHSMRSALRRVLVYGNPAHTGELIAGLQPALAALHLDVQEAKHANLGPGIPSGQWTPAAAAAADCLLRQELSFDFLPPHIGKLKQLASKISARGALYLGGGGVLLVLVLGTLFFMQSQQLSTLEAKWKAMDPRVKKVENIQKKVRTFHPWFDPSAASLRIALGLVTAFPEEGTVWAKSVEIKDLSEVNITCNAISERNRQMLLASLRKIPEIKDVALGTTRLNQFSLKFHWKDTVGNAK